MAQTTFTPTYNFQKLCTLFIEDAVASLVSEAGEFFYGDIALVCVSGEGATIKFSEIFSNDVYGVAAGFCGHFRMVDDVLCLLRFEGIEDKGGEGDVKELQVMGVYI